MSEHFGLNVEEAQKRLREWHSHPPVNALTAKPIRHTHQDGDKPHRHDPDWGDAK